jgi:hypothetical protein
VGFSNEYRVCTLPSMSARDCPQRGLSLKPPRSSQPLWGQTPAGSVPSFLVRMQPCEGQAAPSALPRLRVPGCERGPDGVHREALALIGC